MKFGDSIVMLGDEAPAMGASSPQTLSGTSVALLFYVKDVDAAYARAVAAGATPVVGPADMFWGDRFAEVRDPFGHRWSIATHVADLTPAQMKAGMDAWMASQAPSGG
jgi:PhnB protein